MPFKRQPKRWRRVTLRHGDKESTFSYKTATDDEAIGRALRVWSERLRVPSIAISVVGVRETPSA
jgi:hypothetical protein